MRALVATGGGDLVSLGEVKPPNPGHDHVLVDVRAVSINRGEWRRLLDATAGWRPGWDFAGVVVRTGRSRRTPAPGSRVFGVSLGGSWAEQVSVPANQLTLLPDGISWIQAASLPVAGLTALRVLRLRQELDGRSVLVTGAAGGVGRFAVQLARHAGAKVTALVGRSERAAGAEALGAHEVRVGTHDLDPAFDLVLESVGGDSLREGIRLVAPGGTVVTFGNSSRAETSFMVSDFYPKQAVLRGYFLLDDVVRYPPADDLAYLAELLVKGELRADIDFVADWLDAPAALRHLQSRPAGKIVLEVSSPGIRRDHG
ncbi:MAG: zinc-binding dehydrogenase [Streptosporangiales bacterium]|nr:zinc-binding dehydrogenase [Streptosporangiales bacterium]